jgi:NADH-quinone oxidoreductase subunit M
MLSWAIFLPTIGAALVMAVPRERTTLIRWLALLASLATLAVVVRLFFTFDPASAQMQFLDRRAWVPALGIGYVVGVDGISLLLVALTAIIFPVALLSSWGSIAEKVKEFTVAMLILETATVGTFLSLDLVLFYVFWEAVLIPMYFLIGIWGGPNRTYAAVKFILYTMAASVLMLVAIVALYLAAAPPGGRTFDLLVLQEAALPLALGRWLFAAFTLAFAVKVPLWPLHTWLPDAHVEAPTAGSVILAAILLKLGTYGFLRFSLGLFPEAAVAAAPLLLILALVGIIYGGVVSWAQPDLKRLVAFSSVSHLGFVTLGIFAFTTEALQGALLQMVNHGISTGGLFLVVGVLYDRLHSRAMADYGGVAALMPRFAAIFMIVLLSSAALPATNGFVGEFLILLGVFRRHPAIAAVAVAGVVLSVIYLLWAYQRVMQGPLTAQRQERLVEVGARETLLFVPLIVLIFWIGIYPSPLLRRSEASVRAAVERIEKRIAVVQRQDRRGAGGVESSGEAP